MLDQNNAKVSLCEIDTYYIVVFLQGRESALLTAHALSHCIRFHKKGEAVKVGPGNWLVRSASAKCVIPATDKDANTGVLTTTRRPRCLARTKHSSVIRSPHVSNTTTARFGYCFTNSSEVFVFKNTVTS